MYFSQSSLVVMGLVVLFVVGGLLYLLDPAAKREDAHVERAVEDMNGALMTCPTCDTQFRVREGLPPTPLGSRCPDCKTGSRLHGQHAYPRDARRNSSLAARCAAAHQRGG
jgi:hypothetical protein